jgi:hypothetical protein
MDAYFQSGESIKGFVVIYDRSLDKNDLSTSFKDLSVQKIYSPGVYFKYKDDNLVPSGKVWAKPDITYAKIDPTKYRVTIKNAVDPFTLLFTENFDAGWVLRPAENLSPLQRVQRMLFPAAIADGRHFKATQFFNGWYLRPQDLNGKEEFVLEFAPQNYLYIGAFLSILAAIIGFFALIVINRRNKNGQ